MYDPKNNNVGPLCFCYFTMIYFYCIWYYTVLYMFLLRLRTYSHYFRRYILHDNVYQLCSWNCSYLLYTIRSIIETPSTKLFSKSSSDGISIYYYWSSYHATLWYYTPAQFLYNVRRNCVLSRYRLFAIHMLPLTFLHVQIL